MRTTHTAAHRRGVRTLVHSVVAVLTLLAAMVVAAPAAHAAGDDYPSKWKDYALGAKVDDWGYYSRYCTSWVAWALHDRNGFEMPRAIGNAENWGVWAKPTYAVDSNPKKGSVAWWGASPGNQYGHVAWVESVGETTVTIQEYNYDLVGHYNRRTINKNSPTGYIHFRDIEDTPAPPPPDTDGDGVDDSHDRCPTVFGRSADGCPVKGDYNRDGRADVAGFYRYDGNQTTMWEWFGNGNGYTTDSFGPWSGSGWDGSRIIPAGRDDFNGDGKDDVAAFYRHDGDIVDLNIWYGNGLGDFNQVRAWTANGWDGSRLIPAGSGDFNRDGRADIAAFFRHDGNLVDLRVWYGNGNGYTTEPTGPWTGPGWDGNRIIPAGVGDMDGDGKLDISTFYRHDGGMVDHNVWYGNGVGDFTLDRPWHVDTGWDGSRLIPAGVADYNRDGKADTAMFFRHDNNLVDLRIWYGTSNRVSGTPSGPWSASGWDGSRIISAGASDFNGDGKPDIAIFYDHDGDVLDLDIWYGNGVGDFNQVRAWHAGSAWDGSRLNTVKR